MLCGLQLAEILCASVYGVCLGLGVGLGVQLGFDLKTDSNVKVQWLRDAVASLDPQVCMYVCKYAWPLNKYLMYLRVYERVREHMRCRCGAHGGEAPKLQQHTEKIGGEFSRGISQY